MSNPLHAHPGDPPQCHRLAGSLARPVALGYLAEEEAIATITLSACKHAPAELDLSGLCTRLKWTLRDHVSAFQNRRDRADRAIRRAIWPLCERHAPGVDIIATASQYRGDTLSESDVIDICRSVAMQVTRRARRAAR